MVPIFKSTYSIILKIETPYWKIIYESVERCLENIYIFKTNNMRDDDNLRF